MPLQLQKNALGNVRKNDDAKPEAQKKMVVKKETPTLFLQSNELQSIAGLYKVLDEVMWNHANLQWIDPSYNELTSIEPEILEFK